MLARAVCRIPRASRRSTLVDMTVDTTFFLVGATGADAHTFCPACLTDYGLGYLGGAVLTRLLGSPSSARYHVTALVRSGEKARVLRSFGVDALVGSLDDVEQVTSLAAQADVVIECVCCDLVSFRKSRLMVSLTHVGGCRSYKVDERHSGWSKAKVY